MSRPVPALDEGRDNSNLVDIFGGPGSPLAAVGEVAARLQFALLATSGRVIGRDPAEAIPMRPRGLIWRNLVVWAPGLRRAHLEIMRVPGGFFVLHLCGVPRPSSAAPVFGFDVIGGAGRVTGLFLDLSPVLRAPPAPRLGEFGDIARFAEHRPRPDWGDIFSDDFLAIRPRGPAELGRALDLAERAFAGWLAAVGAPAPPADRALVVAGQNRYAAAQRRNEHTFRMLAGLVGAASARRFIDEALFPEVAPPPADMPPADMSVDRLTRPRMLPAGSA